MREFDWYEAAGIPCVTCGELRECECCQQRDGRLSVQDGLDPLEIPGEESDEA